MLNVITLPAENIRVKLPMSMFEENIEIMFRDVEAVNDAVEKLLALKERMNG